jgi:hypothetical protein
MTDPDRQNPNDPNRPLADVANGSVARRAGARMGFGGIFLWLVIAAAICGAVWFAGWGWGGHRARTSNTTSANGTSNAQPSTADVANGRFSGQSGTMNGQNAGANGAVATNQPMGGNSNGQSGTAAATANDQGMNATGNNTAMAGTSTAFIDSADKKSFVGKKVELRGVPMKTDVNDHAFWAGINPRDQVLVVLNKNQNGGPNLQQGDRVEVIGTVEKAPDMQRARHEWHLGTTGAQVLEHEGAYVQAAEVRSEGR